MRSQDSIVEEIKDEDSFIGTPEFEKILEKLTRPIKNKDSRAACSVVYGHYKGWTPSKVISFYNISEEDYDKFSILFKFKERTVKKMTGRKSKQNNIVSFLSGNVGKVVTPVQMAQDVSISLPTFYNFYNANRGYFKKVKRGHFEILNPQIERTTQDAQ